MSKNKTILIFNGKGGVGKDYLANVLNNTEYYKVKVVSSVDKIKEATSKLQEEAMKLGAKVYEEANKKAQEEASTKSDKSNEDEVVDAEFEEKK